MEVASTVTHEEEKRKLRQTLVVEQKRYNITRQHIQSVQEKDMAIPERKVPPRRPPYRATDVLATKKQVSLPFTYTVLFIVSILVANVRGYNRVFNYLQ